MDSQSRALAGDRNGKADVSNQLQRIELHRRACQRAGHGAAGPRHRRNARSRRPGDPVRRSRRREAFFARAMIRYLADNPDIPVPSPTFTLMQSYELPRFPVVHADLYRLGGAGPIGRARLRRPPQGSPGAAGMAGPRRRLPAAGPARHRVHARAQGRPGGPAGSASPAMDPTRRRPRAIPAIRRFLDASGYGAAERRRIQGDASTRSYERLRLGDQRVILMNSPRRPDGPPVRDGKPLQRHRPPRRGHRAVRRDGQWVAHARLLDAADLRSRAG